MTTTRFAVQLSWLNPEDRAEAEKFLDAHMGDPNTLVTIQLHEDGPRADRIAWMDTITVSFHEYLWEDGLQIRYQHASKWAR